ncbi:Zinc finger BED domain-containing protein 4-like [Oopsacas minuta]|uniref:Zinc finger BED domain-containing protein 4-like n=1 Tax=Oopsacas minuta TaxID=111878 RepID=A0AAV7K4L7_9METZ|nr:Zinc finger BED domain-containing protein 4-like [Oopsacas minuta]
MYKIENDNSNRPVVVECESKQPKSKRTKLFSFMDSDEEDTGNMYTDESQLREYLLKPTIPGNSNPLAFWKDHADTYPKLAILAMKHLAVPVSSAPVEHLYSIAGRYFVQIDAIFLTKLLKCCV